MKITAFLQRRENNHISGFDKWQMGLTYHIQSAQEIMLPLPKELPY